MLKAQPDFADKVSHAYQQKPAYEAASDVEGRLYDGFINDADKPRMEIIQVADEKTLATFTPEFTDKRFTELFVRYKARHFPKTLTDEERQKWDEYRTQKFAKTSPKFIQSLQKASERYAGDDSALFLIEELRLWFESVAPIE